MHKYYIIIIMIVVMIIKVQQGTVKSLSFSLHFYQSLSHYIHIFICA